MLRLTEHPPVVLLDYMMPSMTGVEVLQEVIEDDHLRDGRAFLLMSAKSGLLPASFRSFLATHLIPVVDKPFDVEVLLAAVAHACDTILTRSAGRP
jgi:CheY-like chemotaxis protein